LAPWVNSAQALLKLYPDKFLKISPHEFATIVTGALKECNPINSDALYPEGLVHAIWLGFLYKALENTCSQHEDIEVSRYTLRQAFQKYYEHLGKLLKQKFELPETIELPKIIPPLDAKKILQDEFVNNPAIIEKKLDSALFYAVKSRLFPALLGYANTTYKPWGPTGATFTFPDCEENSIANAARSWSYDLESGKYSMHTLEKRFKIEFSPQAHQHLDSFFQNINDHDTWTALVSNIPYVPYLKSADKAGVVKTRAADSQGFIRIEDPGLQKNYEAMGYEVITATDQACFELRPSVRTLIIVFNHILDLHLFDDIGQEALRPDFVAHYFPKLCEKLNMQGYYALTESTEEQEEGLDIDALDQEGEKTIHSIVTLPLPELGGKLLKNIFSTYIIHGQYLMQLQNENVALKNNNIAKSTLSALSLSKTLLLANLLDDSLLINTPFFSRLTSPQKYAALFALPLYNPDYASKLIRNISAHLSINHNIELLIFNLAKSQPDSNRTMEMLNVLVSPNRSPYLMQRIQDEALETLIKSSDPQKAYEVLEAFIKKNILKTNKDYETFYDAIIKLIKLSPWTSSVSELINKLLERTPQLLPVVEQFITKYLWDDLYQQETMDHSVMFLLLNLTNNGTLPGEYALKCLVDRAYNSTIEISPQLFTLVKVLLSKNYLSHHQKEILHPIISLIFKNFIEVDLLPLHKNTRLLNSALSLLEREPDSLSDTLIIHTLKKSFDYAQLLAQSSDLIDSTQLLYSLNHILQTLIVSKKKSNPALIKLAIEMIIQVSVQDNEFSQSIEYLQFLENLYLQQAPDDAKTRETLRSIIADQERKLVEYQRRQTEEYDFNQNEDEW